MTDTVNGFEIPLRQLTEKELNRKVTKKRFDNFHYAVGEDFLDCTDEGDVLIYAGWLLHKYPNLSEEILELAHEGEVMSFHELEESTGVDAYVNFAKFCNKVNDLKRRVNQVLIQVAEYYNK